MVERYHVNAYAHCLEPDSDGDVVRYSDYAVLEHANARLQERIASQKELIKTTPAAALAAIAKGINEPMACGHGLECWDDSVKGAERCVWCALIEAESALIAARRENAEALFHWVNDEARRKAQGFYMADSVLGEFRAAIRGGEDAQEIDGTWRVRCDEVIPKEGSHEPDPR